MDFSDPGALLNLMKGYGQKGGTSDPGNVNSTQGVTASRNLASAKDAALAKNADPMEAASSTIPSLPGYAPQDILGHKQSPSTLGYPDTSPPDAIVGDASSQSPKTIVDGRPVPVMQVNAKVPQAAEVGKPPAPVVNPDLDKAHGDAWNFINNYKPIQGNIATPQPTYLEDFKNQTRTPAQVFANVVDALGTAGRFMGGDKNATTRRQQEYAQALASQQEANKQYSGNIAQNNETTNIANTGLQQTLSSLGPQAMARIAEEVAPLNPKAQANITEFLGKLPGNITLEQAKTIYGLMSQYPMLQGLFNPQAGGALTTAKVGH